MTEQIPEQHDDEQLEGMSRERLYELVWLVAASTLAKWYGISDNGLATICRRMDVPRPPRGWWTKKEMGKEPAVPSLPPRRSDVPATVRRGRTPVETVEPAQPEVKKFNPVPDRIRNPHPIVAEWLAANLGKDGRQIEKFSEEEKRYHRICDALFKMLEAGGGRVRSIPGRYIFDVDGADIEFYIRRSRPGLRKQYAADPRGTDLLGEPLLVFVVMTHISGLRELWPEGKRRTFEQIVPKFAEALSKAALVRSKDLQKRAEERKVREYEKQRQQEMERNHQRERRRWKTFQQLAKLQNDVDLARGFLGRINDAQYDSSQRVGGRTLADWVKWATNKAAEADPLRAGVYGVFALIETI